MSCTSIRRCPCTFQAQRILFRASVAESVFELVGGTQVRGTATFEVVDGKISGFEVSSELLSN
jgi:hypothetical protein